MAEAVERYLEDSLEEIEYIRKCKLFKKHEISELIRRRRQHEYSLQKRNKRVLDYDSYITTEITILKLLRFRRQKTEDRRYVDKVERSIITRLVRLHRQLCYRFQSRIDLWMRFIKFSRILGRHMSVVRLWNRVLQVHGRTDPRLWAAAASYHLHQNSKAKIRSTLRNLSRETNQLSERQSKLRLELNVLNRYVKKKDKNKIRSLLEELQQTNVQLSKAHTSLTRQRRLTIDRVYLYAIREARRLLTEGLVLNPDCDLLQVELIKLEVVAADFFRSRILLRANAVLDPPSEANGDDNIGDTAQSMDVDEVVPTAVEFKSAKKRAKKVPRRIAEDNEAFMTEVIEDVPFVASGGALKLVLQSALERWSNNRDMLQKSKQIIAAVPHLVDEQLQNEFSEQLKKAEAEEAIKIKSVTQSTQSKSDDLRQKLRDQMTQLCQALLNKGPVEADHLWDSWYRKGSGTGLDLFRTVDPTLDEAVGLFRTRLSMVTIQAKWSFQDQANSDVADTPTAINRADLVGKTRAWLDGLAASRWGEQCPDFWIQYLLFERDCGDCTRLPALQWRASKLLNAAAYKRFSLQLNTVDLASTGSSS